MSLFGPRPGVVWVVSESDPRFDNSWDVEDLVVTALMGREPPGYVKEWTELKERELGVKAPEDLEFGCMKD